MTTETTPTEDIKRERHLLDDAAKSLTDFVSKPWIFKPRYSKSIANRARKKLGAFRQLKTLDVEFQDSLLPKVRRCQIELARLEHIQSWISDMMLGALAFPWIIIIIGSPFILERYVNYKVPDSDWRTLALFYIGYISSFFLAYFGLIITPLTKMQNKKLQLTWMLLLLGIFAFLLQQRSSQSRIMISSTVFFLQTVSLPIATQITFMVFVYLPLNIVLETIIRRIKFSNYTEAVLIDNFIKVIALVEMDPSEWTRLSLKRNVMDRLEEIALCFERFIPAKLNTGDLANDIWFRDTMAGIAATFREQKKWVLTPKQNTRTQFLQSISTKLIHVAQGSWDDLDKMKPEAINRPRFWLERLARALRVILTGLLPIIIVWLIQQSPLALQKDTQNYAVAGAIIWLIITILAAADPLYSEKLTSLKDLAQLLPGVAKEGK